MFDANEVIQCMVASMWAKFNKFWKVIQQILAVAVVLDSWYKLDIVEYYAEQVGLDGGCLNADDIKTSLGDLVVEYQSKLNGNNVVVVGNDMLASSSTSEKGFDLFVSRRKKSKTSSVTAELDAYLMWWKINGPKYPILQEIARDILAILVTSVASESAFSSGGRLLDPHRSRLHQSTVEALMCTRTWLQDNEGGSVDSVHNLEGCFSLMSETRMVQEEAQSEPAILEDNAPRNRAYNLDDID
ncbi:Putative AC transposase [Linum grandiflorum]